MKTKQIINHLSLLLILVSVTSVFKYLSIPYLIAIIISMLHHLYSNKHNIRINRRLLTLTAISITIMLFLNITLNTLVTTLIKVIAVFICIKLLEEKRYRDYMQIIALSLFLITASGLMDIGMIFLLYLSLAIFIINFLMIILTIYDHQGDISIDKQQIKQLFYKTIIIPLLSIPIAILLFFIIPRTHTPLFDFLGRGEVARSGFTSKINLGAVSSIQENTDIIFRARMKEIDPHNLYWRAVVFDIYKDNIWSSSNLIGRTKFHFEDGEKIEYEIYLEPTSDKYLITLDKPVSLFFKDTRVTKTEGLEFLSQKEISKKVSYKGISIITDRFIDKYSDIANSEDKSSIPAKITALAQQLRKDNTSSTITNITDYLKKNYQYSLENLPRGANALEEFLFNHKKGNCEYFASATALLLRANDIPARLVGGFLGGFYNKEVGYYAVSNKNAHVWVEALVNDQWIRVDPTPAQISNFTKRDNLPLSLKVKIYLDIISYYWTKFIVNYNLQMQMELAFKITSEFKTFHLQPDKKWLLALPVFIILAASAIFLHRRRKNNHYYLDYFYRVLKSKGIAIDPMLPLSWNIKEIKDPDLKQQAEEFSEHYNRMLFREKKIEKNTLLFLINRIKNTYKK
ncbi:MAG: DUF3488 and transglutaminase-like domain-containing protein [Calditerrivibrio sp.]|nr:DUF3488 and transglutaminase-like domain-containing protein [Calditerrivibrio sp.]